jgi:hypothetical protein
MVLSIIFFHFFFGLPFVMYFLPSIKARPPRDLPAQLVPGMEHHRMDRRTGLGGEKRRSRDGEVTSAP